MMIYKLIAMAPWRASVTINTYFAFDSKIHKNDMGVKIYNFEPLI